KGIRGFDRKNTSSIWYPSAPVTAVHAWPRLFQELLQFEFVC
ncbi:hypothetical protein A2U01_0096097, partial [Trifolium medium]|nr:hypothetical protein [Trifolium medium]